ncbi:glycoside hydrolase family 15 protein [Swaminathania salitolerans]|uniref:Glycosyl hydrolase n=1 Tax=Swaminathania salitolerans TaxID=182838 RepID=A0A511BSU3_9PROT|nr:glycoside hydrolase family 15 protein [Swaminathania salitolerans]GBQ14038.1 glycosyl hydrolase [Swaminathania salitolerans LMG 21291]GEL02893.1 glycosyl hydrolase [Swaminathania salitolerans]
MSHSLPALADALTPEGPLDGFWPIEDYAALGDGRSVALIAPDGSVDWCCVPNLDSPPMFDRLLHRAGGFFQIRPVAPFTATRQYREDSNVLETLIETEHGSARITESLNSTFAGRLPWTEFARRIEGISGRITFLVRFRLGTRCGTVAPWIQSTENGDVHHIGSVLAHLVHTPNMRILRQLDEAIEAEIIVGDKTHALVALVATQDEPLAVPTPEQIDERIETSDRAWRNWAQSLSYDGPYAGHVKRSALALKLLLYASSGAIAAAATTSLPERLRDGKNWDYRFAWIRDAAYVANAFVRLGAIAEVKAALAWLVHHLGEQGPLVMYGLSGDKVEDETFYEDVDGYRGIHPVVTGNRAAGQHQHGIYGDIFETAALFVSRGNLLDQKTAQLLAGLADLCADHWRQKDAGIWELMEDRHYTMSKVSCWQALDRACQMAERGHLARDRVPRWTREKERILDYIDKECWSEKHQAYSFYAGSDELDASIALAVPFGIDRKERMLSTLDAVRKQLGRGPFIYRYTGMQQEEGAFLACSCWVVEALALLGRKDEAETMFAAFLEALPKNTGTIAEMIDPDTGMYLGNTPQGLSHLGIVHAACALAGDRMKAFDLP